MGKKIIQSVQGKLTLQVTLAKDIDPKDVVAAIGKLARGKLVGETPLAAAGGQTYVYEFELPASANPRELNKAIQNKHIQFHLASEKGKAGGAVENLDFRLRYGVPLYFDGNGMILGVSLNDWASGEDEDDLPTGNDPFTITAWYRGSNTGGGVILNYGIKESTAGQQCYLYLNGNTLLAGFGGSEANVSGSTEVADGEHWFFLAAVYDGNFLKLWVNDDWEENSLEYQADVAFEGDGVYMGAAMQHDQGVDGELKDVRVYAAELSETELGDLFNGTDVSHDRVRWWKIDEEDGTTLHDSSGNEADLTFGSYPNDPEWGGGL